MFEWLKDYQKLEETINLLEYNLETSKSELKRWVSGDLAGVKLSADSNGAKLEESIERIENELVHKKNDMETLMSLIGGFRGLENKIIFKRYIEGKTLITIADELNKSPNYIYNLHSKLMRMIEFADKINSIKT